MIIIFYKGSVDIKFITLIFKNHSEIRHVVPYQLLE